MPRVSPTLEGFRTAFRQPSLTLTEIAWRWTVGAVAWSLFLFSLIEYLGTLPVTTGDAAVLRTRQPLLVGRAIAHILQGSLNRAVLAGLLAALALSFIWIVAASIGRAATVRALLDYFRGDVASNPPTEMYDATEPRPLPSLVGLNCLRAAVALAAILAFVGAAIVSSFASPDANPHPGLAFILFLPLAGSICLVWPALNWLLSLACIFAVRDGEDALGALSAAVTCSRERPGPVFAVSTWTGLAHLTAFGIATTAASLSLAFIHVLPSRLVIAGVVLVTLIYFAIADWLYMARLAGYVCIAEMPDALVSSGPLPAAPAGAGHLAPNVPPQTTVDRDEPILSDVPSPVPSG
jgi:hypothetical protein